jgi:hypothetical protein
MDMNGRYQIMYQIQGGKTWILPKEVNANQFFWDSHWPGQPTYALYGTEWRERDYGLCILVYTQVCLVTKGREGGRVEPERRLEGQ